MPDNDNIDAQAEFRRSPRLAEPDAHGQAALLLAESTLHSLIEKRIFTVDDAIGVVHTAYEVKVDIAAETDESEGRMQQSLDLLGAIADSLGTAAIGPDLPD